MQADQLILKNHFPYPHGARWVRDSLEARGVQLPPLKVRGVSPPDDGTDLFLTPCNPPDATTAGSEPGATLERRTSRLSGPFAGAFMDFAQLDGQPDSLLDFANKYGKLGGTIYDEPLFDWQVAIHEMRFAVDLWQSLRSKNRRQQKELAEGDVRINRFDRSSVAMLSSKPSAWASAILRHEVTSHLDYTLTAQLAGGDALATNGKLLSAPFRVLVAVDSLRSAMWWQLAIAIENEQDFWRCEVCGRFSPRDTMTGRTNKRFCSTNCRIRAFRARKRAEQSQPKGAKRGKAKS